MARGLTDADKFFRRIESLALSTLPTRELTAGAEAPKHHDGVMVALVPDEPESLAVEADDALPAADLHITLCYLGKVQNLNSFDKTIILNNTRRVVDEIGHPFSSSADGVVVMGQNDDGVPATALLIQSEDIVELFDALCEALDFKSDYPTFIPHMTTGYGVPVEVAEQRVGQTINFNKIIVKFGEAIHEVPLSTSIVAAPGTANVIDRVIDSLGRLWDEALHPRDRDGRFIKKNGAVSGKLSVPSKDRNTVDVVDANRASVVGFKTIGNDVWVLAEITNEDGTTSQGFAKANAVRSVAPVKARLDALYPVANTPDGPDVNSGLERQRQLDLILSHIFTEFGPENDGEGAIAFLETLGLSGEDLDYIYDGDLEFLDGIKRIDRPLSPEEIEEQADIIKDAKDVKDLRDRVHAIKDTHPDVVKIIGEHVQPSQQLLGEAPDSQAVAELDDGADPFTVKTDNLLGAMYKSDRFNLITPSSETGISPIEWLVDDTDKTGHSVGLAGTNSSTTSRAYFVKEGVMGAEFDNSDISREVFASLIAEQIADATGNDERALPIPRSVFGDNPKWDGGDIQNKGPDAVHQPAHVISEHAGYFVPRDWDVTDAVSEEVQFRNDIKGLDEAAQADQRAAFNEDMGNLYGNDTAKMILWDFVTLNADRNASNALLASPPDGSEGRVLPIDHGFAFEDDPEMIGLDMQSTYEWFLQLQLTQAWLAYVRGGVDMGENVTPSTVRQVVDDFIDVYGNINPDVIVNRFKSIPGVTDAQIADVEKWMSGVVDRIQWIVDNGDAALEGLLGTGTL